jgi:hypothetical protein
MKKKILRSKAFPSCLLKFSRIFQKLEFITFNEIFAKKPATPSGSFFVDGTSILRGQEFARAAQHRFFDRKGNVKAKKPI